MTTQNTKNLWSAAQACLGATGSLSVIMPAYGLETVIERNIETVCRLLEGNIPFEVLPVDDGSRDGTATAIRRAAARDPDHVHPVFVQVNAGKGNALKCGFAAARGSHILLLDADLDLDPVRITTFFDIMAEKQAAIVIGSKRHPDSVIDYPWHRRLSSAVYYTIVRLLIGLPISDTQTGMKLFTREALAWSFERMLVKTFAFDLEVLSIAHAQGYKVAEAPIEMHFGEKVGCLSWTNVKQVMIDTLAIFYRLRILRYYDSVEIVPPPEKPLFVSVVIACPGPSPYLTECLEALALQTYPHFEVLVLPDAPCDLGPTPFALHVIPTGKIRPAEKRNTGIQQARGEVVAFLDDDAYPVPAWIEQAIKYFTLPDVGGVGGPGVTPPGDPFLGQASGRVYANPLVSGNYRHRYLGDRVRASIDDFPSCNLFVRTDVLRAIGGYRTDFWPGEDTILCADIAIGQKRRIIYDPWVQVFHHRRPLFGPHLRQIGRYALHRGYFAKRFPATSLRISYLIPTFFVLGLVVGAVLACLHPWLRIAYFAVLAFYMLITFLSSVSLSPARWLVTWLGVMATHVVYGVRFAQGLLSRRMPCEVAAFDHPSETMAND
ncbi:MAG TPA: glycosyltransferase [Lentisphaerae bacterium]|jgi:glycosyltransferase involved in cell wall biosynthesis|nr:glycosyltransferase [Lentisphaerota bacterium]